MPYTVDPEEEEFMLEATGLKWVQPAPPVVIVINTEERTESPPVEDTATEESTEESTEREDTENESRDK